MNIHISNSLNFSVSVENLQTAGVRSLLEEASLNENEIKQLQNPDTDTDRDGFVSSGEAQKIGVMVEDVWAIEAGKAKAAEIMPLLIEAASKKGITVERYSSEGPNNLSSAHGWVTSNGTRYDFHLGNDSSYDTSLTLTDADGNRVILKYKDVPQEFITALNLFSF